MGNVLKDYILFTLINKDTIDDDMQEKYNFVIAYIGSDFYNKDNGNSVLLDSICSYIMRSIEYQYLRKGLNPTDKSILSLIHQNYCIEKAYEFLISLQNSHEEAHPCEYEYSHLTR